MKIIGLLGGMSWESTVSYYEAINQIISKKLGGLHSAKCLISSVDFAEIEHLQAIGDWQTSGNLLAREAKRLENAGADCIVICTNTMHKVAPMIEQVISIPLLHIAEETRKVIEKDKISKIALLGTKYTMTQDFYKEKLIEHGIEVMVPTKDDVEFVNQVIYEELCLGKIRKESKERYVAIIDQLAEQGAQGVILGCTEIGLLIKQEDTKVKLFDTTKIHAESAALYSLAD
ncbi:MULTISPECIES: aspartate/glutamate racemase family protein [unclassified Enterococcus]|uniref:aspartate/glutamate racemase family protein n=1 Tax=unclassified Enterococcus TaxID=2608891 RepID=UPI001CE02FDF|nr:MULTISPECIES: aspartate/glutamate racemase family protein [unclassified Enterococcus]MCA5013171.1 aspartate/glutamate racemase family protein [Enterococcus sp. S23]MCA5016421.1 aspartate/glutamate racemase family protein [Enterococcus sp. S22(2020)]